VSEIIVPPHLEKGDEAGARDAWSRVIQLAKKKNVRLSNRAPAPEKFQGRNPKQKPEQGGRISVAEALVKEREGLATEELFAGAKEKARGKGLWLALDSLQDPHNVGAIFRTAGFFGVQGILVTDERSAPLSSTVYDVASGGLEYVPFTLQTNLQRGFEVAKEAGLWILGTSEHARDDLSKIQADRPWLLVIGNEERGMRRLTEESCDVLCKISSHEKGGGGVDSLNASVATGIFISTLTRLARSTWYLPGESARGANFPPEKSGIHRQVWRAAYRSFPEAGSRA
jgi:23S rRNA (guanosine2251-2'-O)-methyltransferase